MAARCRPALLGLAFVGALLAPNSAATALTSARSPGTPTSTVPEKIRLSGCPTCHATPKILTAARHRDARLYVRVETLLESAHATLTCTACHVSLGSTIHGNPQSERAYARASCARCHRAQAREWSASAHRGVPGRPIATYIEDLPARSGTEKDDRVERPTCTTCHGVHDVLPVDAREFATLAGDRCAQCHLRRGESFFARNYHGKETTLGRRDVAGCSDCHGAHLVLPSGNPRSATSSSRVLATCRRCHEEAPANFSGVKIHLVGTPLPNDAIFGPMMAGMNTLIALTFAFFGIHTLLDMRHFLRNRRAGTRPGEEE